MFYSVVHIQPFFMVLLYFSQNNKENNPVNILRENGCSHKSSTERSEKSNLTSETLKTSSRLEEQAPLTDQKCSKPDRGVKRGMKNKQAENFESAGVRISETKPGSKGDQTPEPTAKRTVHPSKSTKEPTVASSPAREHQPKPVINSKPITICGSASVSSTAGESKSEPPVKACQGLQKEKEIEKKTDRCTQVRCNIRLFGVFVARMFSFFTSIDQLHANIYLIII